MLQKYHVPSREIEIRILMKSMHGQQGKSPEIYPIEKLNFIFTFGQDMDKSDQKYTDYINHYIYINVYYYKWMFIYVTALLALLVLIFNLTFLYMYIVSPI